jgi:hypothetical protein
MGEKVTGVGIKIDWSSLSGVILEGGYELKEVLDGRDGAAKLRVRILGSGGRTGLAYFLHLEKTEADDQIDIWQTLREAPHPNLNRPVAVGRREVAGFETIYLLLADSDEKLAAVIPERPLEWEEAAEVLHSCEKALAHLHAHGLIHGSVSPQTVEAIGYTVQLGTEDVRRLGKKPRVQWNKPQYLAPESAGANLTTAADVWCLGATLFEVLAQHPYGTPGAELEKGLPLAAVILRCVEKNPATRCTLKEAPSLEKAALGAEPPPEAAKPIESAAPPAAETKLPPPSTRQSERRVPGQPATPTARTTSAQRIPHPLTPKPAPRQVTKEDMALVPVGKRHRRVEKRQPVGARIRTLEERERAWPAEESTSIVSPAIAARITALGSRPTLVRNIMAGVGLALLFLAAIRFIIIPKLQSTEEPLANSVSAQAALADNHPDNPQNLTVPGSSSIPGAVPSVLPTASDTTQDTPEVAAVPPVRRELFHVVLADYDSRLEAARALDLLNQQHPELFLQIARIIKEAGKTHYLITVGGVLTRTEAAQLHDRLVGKGLKQVQIERYVK